MKSRFEVIRGQPRRPHATIVTGRSGIGKTYLCSTIPDVFFLFCEDGIKGVNPDVMETLPRFELWRVSDRPEIGDWLEAIREFKRIARGLGIKHFVVDTLSGAEKIVNRSACKLEGVAHMEAKDFKKVFAAALPVWQQVQDALDSIRDAGINVWVVAHGQETNEVVDDGTIFTKHDLAFQGSGKSVTELRQFWRQWADHVLFIDWKASVKAGKTMQSKAVGVYQTRILHTVETPTRYAKNRAGLPASLPATWPDLERAMRQGAPSPDAKLRAQIQALIPQLSPEDRSIVEADVRAAKTSAALSQALSRATGLLSLREDEDEPDDADMIGAPSEGGEGGESGGFSIVDPREGEVAAAVEKTLEAFPSKVSEVRRIANSARSVDERLADLRALWPTRPAPAAAPTPAQTAPRAPAEKIARAQKLIDASRLEEPSVRDQAGAEIHAFTGGTGRADQVSSGDLDAFISALESIINGPSKAA